MQKSNSCIKALYFIISASVKVNTNETTFLGNIDRDASNQPQVGYTSVSFSSRSVKSSRLCIKISLKIHAEWKHNKARHDRGRKMFYFYPFMWATLFIEGAPCHKKKFPQGSRGWKGDFSFSLDCSLAKPDSPSPMLTLRII